MKEDVIENDLLWSKVWVEKTFGGKKLINLLEHARLSELSLYWSMVLDKFFLVLSDLTLSYRNCDRLLHLSAVEIIIICF